MEQPFVAHSPDLIQMNNQPPVASPALSPPLRRLLLVCSCLLLLSTGVSAIEHPNIIILFADDQGYQDLGCFGSPNIKTPNIDSLAAKGIRFTNFYSAYCVCSASRASLLTGCYQPRISMPGVLGPRSQVGLHPNEVTIAEQLKKAGYRTQMIGKWHVGDRPQTLPTAQGFDHYFGLPYSNDMARKKGWGNNPADLDKIWALKKWDIYNNELYQDEDILESPVVQTTLTDRYTDEAIKFIKKESDQPFFLYFAHAMPHVPLFVPDQFYDENPKEAYRLTIQHIDWSVGRILETLDELKIADNTLIVYTSDNGPWLNKKHHGGSALPLRAGKGTTYEGGMRVPAVMRWPAVIPPKSVTHEVVGTIDLLPTLSRIVGVDPPPHPIDGLDITPLLKDPKSRSPHREQGYFYYKNGKVEAVRRGKWKLRTATPKPELFDLEDDIGESKNLADENMDLVSELQTFVKEYDEDLKANRRPIWRSNQKKSSSKRKTP